MFVEHLIAICLTVTSVCCMACFGMWKMIWNIWNEAYLAPYALAKITISGFFGHL